MSAVQRPIDGLASASRYRLRLVNDPDPPSRAERPSLLSIVIAPELWLCAAQIASLRDQEKALLALAFDAVLPGRRK